MTHAHGDHLGDGVELAKKTKAPLWGPAGLDQSLQTLGLSAARSGAADEQGRHHHASGSRHQNHYGAGRAQLRACLAEPGHRQRRNLRGGEPGGFIIEFENGFKLYHMGDTALFGDMKFIGEYYKPDLIMIPIGGHFVMNPKDAAYATNHYLKPKFAIPIHYATFPQLKGTPQEYVQALGKTSTKVFSINPGDKLTF